MRSRLLGCLALAASTSCVPSTAGKSGSTTPVATPPFRRVEVVGPLPAFADPDRRTKLESSIPEIEAYLERAVERDGLVGLAAGIVIDDELVWFRGWGFGDPARNVPVEVDTAFGIGSITKSITALAVLLLRDRGELELDRPAKDYLPALANVVYPTVDSPAITIRHLLMHTSGLPRMGNFAEYPRSPQPMAELLAALDGLPLERPPGVRRVYSNLGFQLLGPLVAEVARVDHRAFIRSEILEPVGMTGTRWTPEAIDPRRLALPHDLDAHGEPRLRPHWMPGASDAAGGLYASVEDLAAFARWNLAAWPPGANEDRGPLRASTLREAHAIGGVHWFEARSGPKGRPATARLVGNGLGFSVISTCRHPYVVAHAGKTAGHRASLHMLPHHGVAVVLLTNLSGIHSSVLPADGEAVLDLLADSGGLKPRVLSDAPALIEGARAFARLLANSSPDALQAAFSPDFRDRPQEIAALLEGWPDLIGSCHSARVIEAAEPYEGLVELACEGGALSMDMRVAPWDGHPITSLRILGVADREPSPSVVNAARRMVTLLDHWSEADFRSLLVASTSAVRVRDFLEAVRMAVGRCELAEPRFIERRGGTFVLRCESGRATLRLVLNEAERLIERFEIRDDADGVCR